MKNLVKLLGIITVVMIIGFSLVSCGGGGGDPSNPSDIAVTFNSVTANGSATQTTTQLTLNFSQAIPGLSADGITLSGVSSVVKGTLSGSGPSYTLPISGFSSGGTLNVSVVKSGYAISGASKTTTVYYYSGGGSGTTLSGKYVNDPDYYHITFSSDNTFSGIYGGDYISGTYAVSNNTVTLTIPGYGTETITIVDSTTLRDSQGNDWIKGSSGGPGNGGGTSLSAPTGVSATAQSSSSINITWNAVSDATNYDVYYEVGSSSTKNFAGNTTSTSYTHNSLTASTTYYYYIKAKNNVGESDYSSSDYATTHSSSGGGTAPSAPTGVSATAQSSSSISISWNSVSGAAGYYIYRSSSTYGTYTEVGYSPSTSYTDTGLSASTEYYYKVAAYNNNGTSSQSISYDYATTHPSSSGGGTTEYWLDQPTFGTCSKSGNNLTINWTLQTSGQTLNGLYTYTSPSSIIIQVYNSTTFDTIETFTGGSRRSFTLNNFSAWQYSPEGVSGNRVTIRVLCKAPSNVSSGDRYSTTTYFVESDYWSPSY
jgi:hypothetical protein